MIPKYLFFSNSFGKTQEVLLSDSKKPWPRKDRHNDDLYAEGTGAGAACNSLLGSEDIWSLLHVII